MKVHNPLYRGLYADQIERWFRVFRRSQVRDLLDQLVVEVRILEHAFKARRHTRISRLECNLHYEHPHISCGPLEYNLHYSSSPRYHMVK